MRNVKWFGVSLVVFNWLLVGLGIFALWSNSGATQVRPHVTVVGNTLEIPANIKADLPPGYNSTMDRGVVPSFVNTPDPKDPVALFLIDPTIPDLSIKEQLAYAEKLGKTDVYFLFAPSDQNVKAEPFFFGREDLIAAIQGFDFISLKAGIYDFFSPDNAYAHGTPSPYCGGSTVVNGTCGTHSFTDDDSGDGRTPGFTMCNTFDVCYDFWVTVYSHLIWNIALSSATACDHSSDGCPWTDCMKAHNGSSFIKAPVNLLYKVYPSSIAIKGSFGCSGTSGEVCGCAWIGTVTTPRRNVDQQAALNGTMSCGWITVMRHEAAHGYGYTDPQISNNLNSTNHCAGSHEIHNGP